MATTSLPARASRFSGTAPIRAARPLTWVNDSSAEASSTSTPAAGHRGQDLEEQGGLAHAGWTEDQGHRTGDEPPAQHPVDLDHAGGHREGLAPVDLAQRHRTAPVDKGEACPRRLAAGEVDAIRVFHWPQCGQRPTHWGATPSQAVQR